MAAEACRRLPQPGAVPDCLGWLLLLLRLRLLLLLLLMLLRLLPLLPLMLMLMLICHAAGVYAVRLGCIPCGWGVALL